MGLSCKNAILIVEFAKDKEPEHGGDSRPSAGSLPLRLPILITSFAFIMGWPLAASTGAGAEMRHAMGIAVFAGMIRVTPRPPHPVFFTTVRRLGHRRAAAGPGGSTAGRCPGDGGSPGSCSDPGVRFGALP